MPRRATAVVAGLVLATTACADADPATSPVEPSTPGEVQTTPSRTSPPVPSGTTTPTQTASPPGTPSSPSPPAPFEAAGHTFTADDDGVHAHLPRDGTSELLQSDPRAADPTVDGDAVELVEVDNVTGSGQREWEIRAVAPGTSVLTVPDAPEAFTVTLTVS